MNDERVLQAAIQVLERKLTHVRMLSISEAEERRLQAEHPIPPLLPFAHRVVTKPDDQF
jgi:hypothetical protein